MPDPTLNLAGTQILPVRAIPFVTANLSLRQIIAALAELDSWMIGMLPSFIWENNEATPLAPKYWKSTYEYIRNNNSQESSLIPQGTYVRWEDLEWFYRKVARDFFDLETSEAAADVSPRREWSLLKSINPLGYDSVIINAGFSGIPAWRPQGTDDSNRFHHDLELQALADASVRALRASGIKPTKTNIAVHLKANYSKYRPLSVTTLARRLRKSPP